MTLRNSRSLPTLLLPLLAGLALAQTAAPLGIKTCADDQPDVAECRRSALQQAVPLLAAGIPQLGIAPIDPLDRLPPLTWQSDSTGLALKFRLDDARQTGLGRAVVDDLQVDTVNNRIRVVSHIDGVSTIEGTYRMSGKVLGVPLDGSGLFKLSMHGASTDVTFAGHLEDGEGGHSYLVIDSVIVKLQLGQTHYELTGLFGDYEPLAAAGNMFVNAVAAGSVEPAMASALERWLAGEYLRRAQAVFSTVPYRTLFPSRSAPYPQPSAYTAALRHPYV